MLFSGENISLNREEEKSLLLDYKNNNNGEALEKLIAHCFPAIVSQAYKFANFDVSVKDLVQEGVIGLISAVRKFDTSRGVRLLSYALLVIRHRMMVHAAEFHISVNLNPAFRAKSFKKNDFKEINTLRNVSIDKMTKADTIPNPEDLYYKKEVKSIVLDLVDKYLNGVQKTVICKRVLTENPETLSKIGKDMSITGERVRQIEARALGLIKNRIESIKGLRGAVLGE